MIFLQLVPVLPGALFQMSDRILKGLPFGFKDLFPGESLLLSDLQFACQFLLKALPEILELFFMMLLQILKFGPMRLLDHLTFLKGLPFLRFQSGGGLGGGDPSGFRLRFQPVVFAETGAHGLKFHLFPGQTAPENEKTGGSAGKKQKMQRRRCMKILLIQNPIGFNVCGVRRLSAEVREGRRLSGAEYISRPSRWC